MLERRQIPIGIVSAMLIAASTLGLLFFFDALPGVNRYTVDVHFADAGGISAGDPVLVAGLSVGEVTEVRLEPSHATVSARLDDHALPADSSARVRVRNVVGRRVLEIEPGRDWDSLLTDGDVIDVARTEMPTDVPEVADRTDELLTELDATGVNDLVGALAEVTRDQRDELGQVIDGATRLSELVTDREDDLRGALGRLEEVAGTLNERDTEIIAIIDDLSVVASALADRREEIRRLLRSTNATAGVAADFVEDQQGEIDRILDELHHTTDITDRHQVAIAEALAYFGDAITGFASIGFAGEEPVPWANIYTTGVGPAGVDVIGGCGGFLDRALDEVIGPDPRSCAEQEGRVDDPGETGPPVPPLPGLPELPDPGPPEVPELPGLERRGADAVLRDSLAAGGRR